MHVAYCVLVLILKGKKKKGVKSNAGMPCANGRKLSSAEFIANLFKVLTWRLMKRSETSENINLNCNFHLNYFFHKEYG